MNVEMSLPLKAGSRIGILGGGQLGRMLALAGAALGFDMSIYEPEVDCPAGRVADCTNAPWDDLDALTQFAQSADVLTFEFENVPALSLAHAGKLAPIRPGARSLELTQDRLIEKRFINDLGLKTAPFADICDFSSLQKALTAIGPHGILKTRRFGYDGKGQVRVHSDDDLASLAPDLARQAWILEGLVDFECEVSVILARGMDGDIRAYDVTQNVHRNGILHTSNVPARIATAIQQQAIADATTIAHGLGHVGVLGVEFFVGHDKSLIVNEIAPRVHNSGHWTQDGCTVCQFAQHIRAVAGWPLGDTARHAKAVEMTNLIGDDIENWQSLAAEQGAVLHLYGKRQARTGRKMGHINRLR
jgi:5-(carboxyamino)imidazole ribonucleotide synthase